MAHSHPHPHSHHGPHHPPLAAPLSILRLSALTRLAVAVALSAAIWLGVYFAIG